MRKTYKYHIHDMCGDNDRLNISKEQFIESLKSEITAYIDVCSEKDIAIKFSELAIRFVENKEFKLDINGYVYEITKGYEMPKWAEYGITKAQALTLLINERERASIELIFPMLDTLDVACKNAIMRNGIRKVGDLLALDETFYSKAKRSADKPYRQLGGKRIEMIKNTADKIRKILNEIN